PPLDPSLELGVAARLEGRRYVEVCGRFSNLLRRLQEMEGVWGPNLGDRLGPSVGIWLVPDRRVAIDELSCVAHLAPRFPSKPGMCAQLHRCASARQFPGGNGDRALGAIDTPT